ncbi:hypothetical protein [Nocardia speluncae]|uniref:hypothetical protein n=1 Tax=Nocardia speluncae TaxID=419477 RepID=UPI0008374A1F|nr:hypothetical protein [Nocardia speluncae]
MLVAEADCVIGTEVMIRFATAAMVRDRPIPATTVPTGICHGSRMNGTRRANVSDSSIAATSRTGCGPNRVMARGRYLGCARTG